MIADFGTWRSPLGASDVAAGSLRLEVVALNGEEVYWLEGRPAEAGRIVLVRRDAGGAISDLTPPGTNVRTRVHEYGGGACLVAAGACYYSNFADQRLYVIEPGGEPRALTPPGAGARSAPGQHWFYADAAAHPAGTWLVCVREDHTDATREPVNTLVRIPLDRGESAGDVIASGYDFYSTPRFRRDGMQICWLSWRHPQMPWDGTELWVASVAADGSLRDARRVAGGPDESIVQPGWLDDGSLCFVSDRTGWWNLYRQTAGGRIDALCPMDAEFARPQWQFGMSTWAAIDADRLAVAYRSDGLWHAAVLAVSTGVLTPLARSLEPGNAIVADARRVAFVGRAADAADRVVRVDLETGAWETLQSGSARALDSRYVSHAEPIAFETDGGETAYGFFYPPHNPEYQDVPGARAPLIVISHGGPTSAATRHLDLEVQFWTTRGFAVVDVDYRGSSGYGRAYRRRLDGAWGIADVADCIAASRYLVARGAADPQRLIVRGRSAGGYTTLAALTFRPGVFNAGASHYGVGDVEVLARDTHKFESRYLDKLIGEYPARRDLYRDRSPIHFVDRLACPLILLQGLEDRIVPPNQAELMADAVRRKGVPVALLMFPGEQHGFRRTETIVRALEAELSFYAAVFGFTPADDLPPIQIDNLEGRRAKV